MKGARASYSEIPSVRSPLRRRVHRSTYAVTIPYTITTPAGGDNDVCPAPIVVHPISHAMTITANVTTATTSSGLYVLIATWKVSV